MTQKSIDLKWLVGGLRISSKSYDAVVSKAWTGWLQNILLRCTTMFEWRRCSSSLRWSWYQSIQTMSTWLCPVHVDYVSTRTAELSFISVRCMCELTSFVLKLNWKTITSVVHGSRLASKRGSWRLRTTSNSATAAEIDVVNVPSRKTSWSDRRTYLFPSNIHGDSVLPCFGTIGWVIWPVKTRPRYDL